MDEEVLSGISLDALSVTIEQLAAAQMAMLVGLLELIGEYDRRQGWAADGMASMTDWVAARLAVSQATSTAWVEAAARLAQLPELRAVAAAGGLSFDQLVPLLVLATPQSDARWAAEGPALKASQLRQLARRARPVTPDDDRSAHERRSLRSYWRRDGMLGLTGRLTGDAGAVVAAALRRLAEGPCGAVEGTERATYEQRCADALVQLASTRMAADTDADAAAVVVHAPVAVLGGQEGNADVEGGPVISGETLRRLACDCTMRWVLYDHDGAVTVTEAKAALPRWLRRLVKARDLTCRFPGCERRGFGQVHHVIWRSRGGQAEMGCLAYLCWSHHRYVHEGGWDLAGDADGELVFTSPQGRRYTTRPAGLERQAATRLFGPDWDPGSRPPGPPTPPSRN
ncbi:MAG TPA: DUF222 domain-containing protein [Acidimicrobiales bacterium]